MRFPLSLWGLATQMPFSIVSSSAASPSPTSQANMDFQLKEGPDIFSPKDMLELERPSSAVPNVAGDMAFVTVSRYSFEDRTNNRSLVLLPLQSNFQPIANDIPLPKGGEFFWLDGKTLAYVVEGDSDGLELYAVDLFSPSNSTTVPQNSTSDNTSFSIFSASTLIGTFPTKTATNFRYNHLSGHLIFSDYVYADGDLTTVKEQDEAWDNRGNSAFVYDQTYERHWDTWTLPKRPALFSVGLSIDPDRKWIFGNQFFAPLKGTGHHCPVEPFGGLDDFDVSKTHIVYTTKDPVLPEAWHTKQNVYIVDIEGKQKPRELTSGKQGATHAPVFNHQGDKVAWLELDEDGYESDRAKIVIYDLTKDVRFTITQNWDRSPDSLAFNPEGTILFLTAGDQARGKIFYLPVPPTPAQSTTHPNLDDMFTTPIELTSTGAASSIFPLPTGRLLFTRNSLTSPNDIFMIQHLPRGLSDLTSQPRNESQVEQLTHFAQSKLKGKGLSEGEEFWFEGANGKRVQGWALKPRGWKEGDGKKKWPVAFLIHGGPQSAWEDQWSTRWNPNVFTGQGYFVIAINPTGSTTFGQDFVDAIKEDWGGKPFVDLINGWKYAIRKWPEIDPDRAVAAGASWGGYAINWIQGHPEFGFGFKALVTHDGVFDANYNGYSTDELFFFNHEWGGRPWDPKAKKVLAKFNPVDFVDRWSTPHLLFHSSKDYRLPETEGIGAFHALQQLGVPSRLVIFPDENHWVLNPGNSLKWHYEVFRWFDLYINGKKN